MVIDVLTVEITQNDTTICEGDSLVLEFSGPGYINGYSYGGYFNGSYYYASNSIDSWTNNNNNANANGGHLVTINSQQENDFVQSVVSQFDLSGGGAHIGCTDSQSEGSWLLSNG